MNNNKINSKKLDPNNITNINNNISDSYNNNNNNIQNHSTNINLINVILNYNDLTLILKQILLNQNSILTNLNKYIFQFNQISSIINNNVFQSFLSNNFNIININLGIINNYMYNFNNSHNKNHINNFNIYSLKQERIIESEYKTLKKLEKEGQTKIKDNLKLFEENILLPIYNEIISNNNNSELASKYILNIKS